MSGRSRTPFRGRFRRRDWEARDLHGPYLVVVLGVTVAARVHEVGKHLRPAVTRAVFAYVSWKTECGHQACRPPTAGLRGDGGHGPICFLSLAARSSAHPVQPRHGCALSPATPGLPTHGSGVWRGLRGWRVSFWSRGPARWLWRLVSDDRGAQGTVTDSYSAQNEPNRSRSGAGRSPAPCPCRLPRSAARGVTPQAAPSLTLTRRLWGETQTA